MSQSTSESKPSSYSLLTDNASPLERALEHTLSKHLDQVTPPFPQLRNAKQTPESALSHLAADRMVTYWQEDDSLETKRAQVASAQSERRQSGTKEGIRIALGAIGYKCEIKSRYENPQLPPYMLEVIAWKVDSSPVSGEIITRVLTRLEEIKSTRDTVELALALNAYFSARVAMARAPSVSLLYSKAKADLWLQPDYQASVSAAIAYLPGVVVSNISAIAKVTPKEVAGSISPTGAGHKNAIQIHHVYATARTT